MSAGNSGRSTADSFIESRKEVKVPASQPSEHRHEGGIHGGGEAPATTTVAAGLPARLSLGDVDRAAKLDGLKPGYTIVLPVNTTDDKGTMTCGSYQLSHTWPDRSSAEQTGTWTSSPVTSWHKATPRRSARSAGDRTRCLDPHRHPVRGSRTAW